MSLSFGRFTDSDKSKSKVSIWYNSEKLYREKKFMDSYEAFLNYVRDDNTDNLDFRKTGNEIHFKFFQGSNIIKGNISDKGIVAESDIAEFEKPPVAVMRRLLELNYSLLYCRYAFNNNKICLKFNSRLNDGAPRKIYYALKELASNADRQDDLLTNEFKILKPLETGAKEVMPEHEKQIKYKYFRKWIDEAVKITDALNQESFTGAISYVLLNTLYKIDYLITPQGIIMTELERLNWQYFANDNKPYSEKNRLLKNSFLELLNKPETEILKDFYKTRSTFGIPLPSHHDKLVSVINRNIENVKYYIDNNYKNIALNIYEYIASHSLFSYGLPQADLKLLDLIMRLLNQDYLAELGADELLYHTSKNSLKSKLIKKEIKSIIDNSRSEYPDLGFNTEALNFDSLLSFLRSYYNQIKLLNFNG